MSEQHESTPHIVSPWVYIAVYLALVTGVGLTVFVSYHNLGILNPILAVAIAVGQTSLVALFSMHLKYGSKLNQLSVGSCIFVFLILVTMVLLDYSSRAWGSW